MDENLSDASDLTTDPTLDFFGKAVALSDRHVGVHRYMEIDPYHSTDPPSTDLVATVHSGHAADLFGDFVSVPHRGIRENARSALDNAHRCPGNDCRDEH